MAIINYSFLISFVVICVAWLIYASFTGTWNPGKLIEGTDGRLSTSKFQWIIWILTIFFAYVTIYAARWLAQGYPAEPITDIPENVFAILGFSAGTAVVAKGITQSYVAAGLVAKSKGTPSLGDLVQDDTNIPEPFKLQIFLWTLLAISIYIISLVSIVTRAASAQNMHDALEILKLPDIDNSLVILSGLSAGSYLGNKIVTKDAPRQ